MTTDFFLPVDLQHGGPAETAVCVRQPYGGAKANVILFLHGKDVTSIKSYLASKLHQLREIVDADNKDVILIAPTLTKAAQGGLLGGDDQDSIATKPLETYFGLVWAALQKLKPTLAVPSFEKASSINKLVIAAHSGGGKVMLALARAMGKDAFCDRISELWGLDCLYGTASGPTSNPIAAPKPSASSAEWNAWLVAAAQHRERLWSDWAATQAKVPFYLYYSDAGGTQTRSDNLASLAQRNNQNQIKVTHDATISHESTVNTYFKKRLGELQL